jgi:hypothetical protein
VTIRGDMVSALLNSAREFLWVESGSLCSPMYVTMNIVWSDLFF